MRAARAGACPRRRRRPCTGRRPADQVALIIMVKTTSINQPVIIGANQRLVCRGLVRRRRRMRRLQWPGHERWRWQGQMLLGSTPRTGRPTRRLLRSSARACTPILSFGENWMGLRYQGEDPRTSGLQNMLRLLMIVVRESGAQCRRAVGVSEAAEAAARGAESWNAHTRGEDTTKGPSCGELLS